MGYWAHSGRGLLSVLLFVACGEFDNSIIAIADLDEVVLTGCAEETSLQIGVPVLPPLREGRGWAGWLHVDGDPGGDVEWEVSGLPAGIWFNPEHRMMAGIPLLQGTYDIRVVARRVDCPEVEDIQSFKLQVTPECVEDCGEEVSCADSKPGTLRAYVLGVTPGSTFAANGLKVEAANTARTPGADTTHLMVLSDPESTDKEKIVIHHSLPGGVPLVLDGEVVDLRYIHGLHDDHYLFLSANQQPRFIAYIGHLSSDEIIRQCPSNDTFAYCQLPAFEHVPVGCAETTMCGGRQRLALDVPTVPQGSPTLTIVNKRLLPGQAGQLPNNTLMRVVDAWQHPVTDECYPPYTLPYFRSFYILPLAFCSYSEVHPVLEDTGGALPTVGVYESRVLYPLKYQSATFQWARELPYENVYADVGVDSDNRFWVDMPMAGDYRIFSSADVILADGKVMEPCHGRPAERVVGVYPAVDVRVEVVWSAPTAHGTNESAADLQLQVGTQSAAGGSGEKLKFVELQTLSTAQSVVVTFPPGKGLAEVTTWVRIWLKGALIHEHEDKLAPGDIWIVGVIGVDIPGGFAVQWPP